MIALPLNFIVSFTLALILHELGHLTAARLCRVPVTAVGLGWGPTLCTRKFNNVEWQIRLLPFGAFVRMDMRDLQLRKLNEQLLVLGAGIGVNLTLAVLMWGSVFGFLNLALAIGNVIPLYQQDGWKSAIVVCRKFFGKPNPVAEWGVTVFGGLLALGVVTKALFGLF